MDYQPLYTKDTKDINDNSKSKSYQLNPSNTRSNLLDVNVVNVYSDYDKQNLNNVNLYQQKIASNITHIPDSSIYRMMSVYTGMSQQPLNWD